MRKLRCQHFAESHAQIQSKRKGRMDGWITFFLPIDKTSPLSHTLHIQYPISNGKVPIHTPYSLNDRCTKPGGHLRSIPITSLGKKMRSKTDTKHGQENEKELKQNAKQSFKHKVLRHFRNLGSSMHTYILYVHLHTYTHQSYLHRSYT